MARLMFANSEFLVLLNQAATDRAELAKLLNISENQMGYNNVEAGHGLLVSAALLSVCQRVSRTGALYQLEHHSHRQVKPCQNSLKLRGVL